MAATVKREALSAVTLRGWAPGISRDAAFIGRRCTRKLLDIDGSRQFRSA